MIQILFEDGDMLAANKPENLASIPTRVASEDTVLAQLSAQYGHKIFVVHRLDKEVSGVMLFAKNAAAHKNLNDQFFKRKIKKTYWLAAHGRISDDAGTINKPIRQFGSGRMGVDLVHGKESTTSFKVLERGEKFTLVSAEPLTGRRHQIRVHFYDLSHPIVGDLRYGDKVLQKTFPRLMLHAASITFALGSGEKKTVESPLPESILAWCSGNIPRA
jgi:tRNA pseudouridine32 synthase/23S rRNA pseudouridine746 synthase